MAIIIPPFNENVMCWYAASKGLNSGSGRNVDSEFEELDFVNSGRRILRNLPTEKTGYES